MYSQNPQQQWVLGEEEEANGYADEQTAARESSEMECTKKNSRSDRPQNQRREQQQRVQQPEGAAAREQPQQGKMRNDDVGEQQTRKKASDPTEPKKGTV